ncbi:MAG: hypothetical protein ACK5LT_08660 [Lachnospirales bacterium]
MRNALCILIISLFLFTGCSNPAPDGYTTFNTKDIPYKFHYPKGMQTTFINDKHTLINLTSPEDPAYYYVITGGEALDMEDHYKNVIKDIRDTVELVAGDGVLDIEEFFEFKEYTEDINGNKASVYSCQITLPDENFTNILYKIPITDNYTIVAFYASVADNSTQKDVIFNSFDLKK